MGKREIDELNQFADALYQQETKWQGDLDNSLLKLSTASLGAVLIIMNSDKLVPGDDYERWIIGFATATSMMTLILVILSLRLSVVLHEKYRKLIEKDDAYDISLVSKEYDKLYRRKDKFVRFCNSAAVIVFSGTAMSFAAFAAKRLFSSP